MNLLATAALWRRLKSGIYVLDLNKHFPRMTALFSELPVDALDFLLESLIYFS